MHKTHEFSSVNPRVTAVEILTKLEKSDAYVDRTLQAFLENSTFTVRDNNLLSELVRGCIRYKLTIDSIIMDNLANNKTTLNSIVKNSLRIAVYQLVFLSKIPANAAVNESVQIVKRKKGVFLSKVANAVLRSIVSSLDSIKSSLFSTISPQDSQNIELLAKKISFPQWMIQRCIEQFPEYDIVSFFSSLNHPASMNIREITIHKNEISLEQILNEKKLNFQKSSISNYTYIVNNMPIGVLKELFENQRCFVQDESASMVVELLSPKYGESVLDVCAAPGGKSFAIADMQNNSGHILSNDQFETKTSLLQKNSLQLGFTSIKSNTSDLFLLSNMTFDAVLLDAPCSGLGVIRKKPDIKWRRTSESIDELQQLQMKAIEHCSSLVKIGGTFVYSTCTYETSENEDVVQWFLQRNSNFILEPAEHFLPTEVCRNGYLRTFTHIHGCDSAFGARMKRIS